MSQIELILSRHGNGRCPAERVAAGGDSPPSRNGLGRIYREGSG
ncbi:hypothetical protein [Parabacteroides hominis]|nr:hypothetical protein [uncultured Parabacteroides sp.]